MESLLGKLFLAYALYYLGMSLTEVLSCRSGNCFNRIEKAKLEVLRIDWKPISIFPAESKRFK